MVAFALTLIMTPLIEPFLPKSTHIMNQALFYILRETLLGLFIGSMTRVLLYSLQVTTTLIGMQTSLSSATLFNPALGSQDTILTNFLLIGAMTMIFATNSHHEILKALLNSYETFPVGGIWLLEDMTSAITEVVSKSFFLGVRLSFPIIIVSTVLNVAAGLLNRLMPQLQVYFMIMPLQILVGFIIFALTVSFILTSFIEALLELVKPSVI